MVLKMFLSNAKKDFTVGALTLGLGIAASTQAAVILPEKSGFSGYFNLGVGGVSVESNMLASIMSGNLDVGDKEINNFTDSPNGSEGGAIPVFNFEVSYTFASTRTQLYVGNLLEDFLSFDTSTIAGVRQDVGRAGLVGASLQRTSFDTQVWSDPYLTDAKRKDTDRTSKGFRLYWQQIMGSGLELRYSTSEIDIDEERSGQSLSYLTSQQRKLLDRNGDVNRFQVSYELSSDNKAHILTPALTYVDRDFDGKAMANDGGTAALNYIYQHNERWRYVLNASYGDLDFKEANPIYDEKDSATNYGISATVFYTKPFGWKDWSFNATAGWFDEDHDIDFYDNSVSLFTVGMFRRF